VTGDGTEVRLEAKAMLVLVYLSAHAGRVVSRAELEQELWPGRIVTEDSVTNAVAKLRRVFSDDPHNPQVIETVPKSGYRLIAEVGPIESTDRESGACFAPTSSAERYAWRPRVARMGVVLRGAAEAIRGQLPGVLPDAWTGTVLCGGLAFEDQALGVLAIGTDQTDAYLAEHEPILAALCEPIAVALRNDHQLRELKALREAAEADRRSLLARLDRQDIADTIVGERSGLEGVMRDVDLVARSDAPVLILGETGTGKEVVARAVHSRSGRAAGPFLRVNCGAIPPELADSELFGHERGSFTGATARRQGWFERADGGTLFLDEIGELTPAVQVRLLRILQDGSFERVGGQQPLHADVRLIAATHQDLQAMVAAGRFRADLWYRIHVFPIRLPPLRDRPDDIPALALHFARRAAQRLGLMAQAPGAPDIALLLAYPWPGNVRELAAVMERAAILGDGRRLAVAEALGGGTLPAAVLPLAQVGHTAFQSMGPTITTLDTAARTHIEAALAQCLGRIEGPFGAARLLGINPNTLRAHAPAEDRLGTVSP
jgi:transcriptional regulator with GAF, ATPase, and Fis domain